MIDDRIRAIGMLRGGLDPKKLQETILEEHQTALQKEAEKITDCLQERKLLESARARNLLKKAGEIKVHAADERQLSVLKESFAKIKQAQEEQKRLLDFSNSCLRQLQGQKEDFIQEQIKLGQLPAKSNFINDLTKYVGENLTEYISKNCQEGNYVRPPSQCQRKQN